MKVFTVVHLSGDGETTPFAESYTSLVLAALSVQEHAVELHNCMRDPNQEGAQAFPGLDWSDDLTKATERDEGDDGCGEYWITETVLK